MIFSLREDMRFIENIKCSNWRHKVFNHTQCNEFPNRCKDDLHYHVEFGGYADNQLNLLLKWLHDISEDKVYNFLFVLLAETLIILTQQLGVPQEDSIDGGKNLEDREKY